jgi:hypothetical protein
MSKPELKFIDWMSDHFPYIVVNDARQKIYKNPDGKEYSAIDFDDRVGVCFHQVLGYAHSWDAVSKYHARDKGWPGIAYTMGICTDGSISIFWDFDRRCYSQGDKKTKGDENVKWLGVALNGKLRHKDVPDGEEPTVEQMMSMLAIVQYFRDAHNWNFTTGHFMFHKPECPGETAEAIVRAIRFNEQRGNKNETDFHDFCSLPKNRQLLLTELGYYKGKIDGDWGPVSKEALERFQIGHGLHGDGIWGTRTEAKLYEVVTAEGIFPK